MNRNIHFLTILFLCLYIQAQETMVNLSMGAGYTDQVYYKLKTETENTFSAASWDIAFLRTDPRKHGIRVNDAIGIEVYEASNNPDDWDSIDLVNKNNWNKLYNSDTEWDKGAFMKGSASQGWGEYQFTTHHITGTIIYVLKYPNGTYRKFINEEYFGEYTFKYATWNGSEWGDDTTVTISNSNNPNNRYNYYSIQNNTEINAEPNPNDWDLLFTKYFTEISPGSIYNVAGVLQNNKITVAETDEPDGITNASSLTYSSEINTIGSDWKTYSFFSGYTVDTDKAFYIKYEDGSIYRMNFSTFSGQSTGNLSFKFKEVTNLLGSEEVTQNFTFGIYPNPTLDKKVTVLYETHSAESDKNSIDIYSLTGTKVFSTPLSDQNGFYNKEINLSDLKSGVYLLKLKTGDQTTTKKIVLNERM